jgi:sulfoquinovosyltransferase
MQGIQSRQLELNFYVSKVMRFLMMRWIFTSLVVTLLLVQLEALRLYSMSQAVSFNGYTSPLKSKPPLKVLLLVEPTPFNYVSGYANRFKEMLRHLKRAGDEVQILTPDPDPNRPKEFLGFPITSPAGFPLFIYKQVSLTLDFKRNIPRLIRSFKPDLIHVSSPSCIAVPAILWARLLKVPLVMSYHTDMAGYAKNYFPAIPNIVKALCDFAVKTLHRFADLTLCTSPQLKYDLQGLGVRRVDVWQKGINTEVR